MQKIRICSFILRRAALSFTFFAAVATHGATAIDAAPPASTPAPYLARIDPQTPQRIWDGW
jgi:hypothetical protein